MDISEHRFGNEDSRDTAEIARALKMRLLGDPQVDFPQLIAQYKGNLPTRVVEAVAGFAATGQLACIFRFSAEFFEAPPATPDRFIEKGCFRKFTAFQLAQILCLSLLGEPIGYRYVRGGSLISNIIPIAEHAHASNVTSNSARALEFHTEDAFHPYRADYLALGCLRNDERVPTWLSCVRDCEIDPAHWDILTQEDVQLRSNKPRFDTSTYPPQRVLSNVQADPLLRLPVHRELYRTERANAALGGLVAQLHINKKAALLAPGEILVFDNARVAHARDAYEARIERSGGARWLSRTLHVLDFSKAAAYQDRYASNILC